MCGIVGYVGKRPVQDLLLAGLTRLEYRGYDSAGISMIPGDTIESVRAVGNLDHLREAVASARTTRDEGAVAVATRPGDDRHRPHALGHARPRERDERPPALRHDRLGARRGQRHRRELHGAQGAPHRHGRRLHERDRRRGHRPPGLASPGHRRPRRGRPRRLRRARGPLRVRRDAPRRARGPRRRPQGVPARRRPRRRRDVPRLRDPRLPARDPPRPVHRERRDRRGHAGGRHVPQPDGAEVEREVKEIDWDDETAEKGGFETFMLKEIHEQADAVAETIADRTIRDDGVDLDDAGALDEAILRDVKRIVVVACGTSYHAGLIGRYALEEWARIPVEMDIASEYRYRNPVVGPGDLVIGITQSGETADTLAAMRIARERGATVLAITNIMGSQATRDADGVLFTRAGLEVVGRGDEDVRLPGRGHVPARPAPRRAARDARPRAAHRARRRPQAHPALHPGAAWGASARASTPSPSASGTRTSSCTSAATSACRWRSRARSSSRRSPTSRPTPTRRAR